ncbi:MAG: AraC family transcriptional regulator [Bacteroidaceae bacterium]|nr:AraC family transcriptional regulator [Bacteroidaceae bacterium]
MKEYVKNRKQTRSVELYARILHFLTKRNRYLSPDITAELLARELECTSPQISVAVRVGGDANFSALLNELRLKEACKRMASSRYTSRTAEDIALGCGYKSRQAFYTAFERHFGMTPRQWRLEHCPNSENEE